jgi:citrate synthase
MAEKNEKLATTVARGLEGVLAGESSLSFIDGQKGRLSYRGYDILELAEKATFEEVAYLLWYGSLPNRSSLDDLKAALSAERALPSGIHGLVRSAPRNTPMMEILRTSVSALSLYDPEANHPSREANLSKAVRLTARIASIVGAAHRLLNGQEPAVPRPELSHAAHILYSISGQLPDARRERVLDIALVLHADHGFNASTFAGRVAAATLSDMYSAVTASIATLKGPLHGGANVRVMEMLRRIGTVDKAETYVQEALARKERIFGFGHRVYKTEDPRATVLRRLAKNAGQAAGDSMWFDISQKLEEVVKREKGLFPNVDFYSASLYHALGLPVELFVAIFTASRVAGWTAHLLEQYADNRLIRPRSRYVGPPIGQALVPLDDR